MFRLENVVLRGDRRPRLDAVTVTLAGQSTALLGCSGSGKTSLLNLLAGYEQPHSGTISRTGVLQPGKCIDGRALPVYWAPQDGGLWGHLTVRRQLELVAAEVEWSDARTSVAAATELLAEEFRLQDRLDALPGELSAGERSRVSLARAIAARPTVLLLDEPLSHVDPVHRSEYWDVLRKRTLEVGVQLVFSSHEPVEVMRTAERAVCLDEGRVVYSGLLQDLYRNPPNLSAGRLLGPLNWFAPAVADRLAAAGTGIRADRGFRPEMLQLQPTLESGAGCALFLAETEFCGSFSRSLVRSADGWETVILHSAAGPPVVAGSFVRLHCRQLDEN